MDLLLDTHALLWLLNGSSELSSTARSAIAEGQNRKLWSIASLWEITIKVGKRRLDVGQPLSEFFKEIERSQMLQQLPIVSAHLSQLETMPLHHGDPFDRLVVAQALSEDCTLVSKDGLLGDYGVKRLW